MPLSTIRDDIALDDQIYRMQEQQVKTVSRSFFKRFTSNQQDWKDDYAFIFKHIELVKSPSRKLQNFDLEKLASSMRFLSDSLQVENQ